MTDLVNDTERSDSRATAARLAPARPADATAADHLLVHVPTVGVNATAAEARAAALASPDGANVYVVGDAGELAGLLPLSTLLALTGSAAIASHLEPAPPTVTTDTDQEHVAQLAIRHTLAAVPVIALNGQFLGIIPASVLLKVLLHEHIEDVDRLSGILRQKEHVTHALDQPPTRRVAERLPWLLVGLAGSGLATWIVAAFETSLERSVTVAFFIPGIVYLADAIGTQTEAVAVRSFSFRQPRALQTFLDELRTGFLLGLALAAPVLPTVGYLFDDFRLAAAVALAICFAGTTATAVGFAFPLLLSRCNRDPALGSGPLATVVQDVLSLLAYFFAVQVLLPG